jgi:hypothetical protein
MGLRPISQAGTTSLTGGGARESAELDAITRSG